MQPLVNSNLVRGSIAAFKHLKMLFRKSNGHACAPTGAVATLVATAAQANFKLSTKPETPATPSGPRQAPDPHSHNIGPHTQYPHYPQFAGSLGSKISRVVGTAAAKVVALFRNQASDDAGTSVVVPRREEGEECSGDAVANVTIIPAAAPIKVEDDSAAMSPVEVGEACNDAVVTVTVVPAVVPAVIPSDVPAVIPSDVPAVVPSNVPAADPAKVEDDSAAMPTAEVGEACSGDAVVTVTVVPAVIPSDVPAVVPDAVPETVPADDPEALPSNVAPRKKVRGGKRVQRARRAAARREEEAAAAATMVITDIVEGPKKPDHSRRSGYHGRQGYRHNNYTNNKVYYRNNNNSYSGNDNHYYNHNHNDYYYNASYNGYNNQPVVASAYPCVTAPYYPPYYHYNNAASGPN